MSDVTPKRCAMSMTLWMPTRAASLTAGTLRDSAKALVSVIAPFVVVLVVVRRVAAEADRRVDDDVVGLGAIFDRRGVDVGLEAGAGLALGLRGAVELRERVVAAAHHGENVAGGVVDGEDGALRAGVLLEGGALRAAFARVGEMNVDHVARLDERIAVALAGPGPVCRKQDDFRWRRRARESPAAATG